jgi:hypothetical protein
MEYVSNFLISFLKLRIAYAYSIFNDALSN